MVTIWMDLTANYVILSVSCVLVEKDMNARNVLIIGISITRHANNVIATASSAFGATTLIAHGVNLGIT
jgi:hypothetical protein